MMESSDLDMAFNLQLQEALTASLSLQPHQPPPPPHSDQPSTSFSSSSDQELKDRVFSEAEFKKLKDDIHRRVHDHRLALEISQFSDDDHDDDEWVGSRERPFGEEVFKIYFKGLVEEQQKPNAGGKLVLVGGIGVAICDSADQLLFELRKPLVGNGKSRQWAEIRALIDALDAALELQLTRIAFYCDYYPIYNYVTGRWSAKQKKLSALVKQVSHLQQKFTYCQPYLVARNDIKYAFKLAREAITSQINKPAEVGAASDLSETCAICLEDTNISQIFSVDRCMHRYCFSCMKQHVEVKLLHGILPACPHEGCKTELTVDGCSKFLTPRLVEIMSQRIREASIPVTDKIYCPYPKCSALMSKKEVLEYSKNAFMGSERSVARKCIKCNGRFCINCRVPWHSNMTCFDYKRRNPHPQLEEAKLKNLAATNLWRQCVRCSHMIELAAGCYHMTCRCGFEFCYTCGAEWKNKKATCSCPLWDEENILEDELEEEEEEEEEEIYESDSDEYW